MFYRRYLPAQIIGLLLACLLVLVASFAKADTYVDGYYRKDGTYVEGHYKTTPQTKNWDAYSTDGNSNPYTGNDGQRARDYSPDSQNYGSGRVIFTGPRGGQYYINDSGRKVYVPKR